MSSSMITMAIVQRGSEPDIQQFEMTGEDLKQSTSLLKAPSPFRANGGARMHSKEDWEAMRSLIERLYCDEGRPLKQVTQMLCSDHGFMATDRQYKRRLKEWGLVKNIKSSEMEVILRKAQTRKELGKHSTLKVRGREVNEAKMSRWMKHSTKQDARLRSHENPEPTTPPDIVVYTPPVMPSVHRPSTLDSSNSKEKLLRWLSSADPSINHRRACQQRLPHSCRWLTDSRAFAQWKLSPGSLLWLHGRAGCGKTFLSSAIIENVKSQFRFERQSAVIYFYFDFNDNKKQNLADLFRSLITQLLLGSTLPSKPFANLYARLRDGKQPPKLFDLQDSLTEMLLVYKPVYILLDALDECTERSGLLQWLDQVGKQHLGRLHLFASSRRETDLVESFANIRVDAISIKNSDVDCDIRAFIKGQLTSQPRLSRLLKSVKAEITEALMEKANGMFLWVVCQLDVLQKCLSINAIRSALNGLPETLNDAYERILMNIDNNYKDNVFRVLHWLIFSAVPLRIDEIAEILIAKPDSNSKVDINERLLDPNDILMYCGALVTTQESSSRDLVSDASRVTNTSRELRLAHVSVQEYLFSRHILCGFSESSIFEAAAHLSIAGTCLTYLFQFADFQSLPVDILNSYPLAGYAAQYWAEHARKAGQVTGSHELNRRIVHLLNHEQLCTNWIQLYNPDACWEELQLEEQARKVAAPLYYASLLGLPGPTEIILKGADVDSMGGRYGTALQAASARGHEEIVKLLVEKGAHVNAQGSGYYSNALQAASARGHEAIARLLIEKGADVNAQGGDYYDNALQAASDQGHEAIARLLIEKGADVNAQGGDYYDNALQAASDQGHEAVVKLLLEMGSDSNAQGRGYYGTTLQVASARGHEKIVRLLIEKGADDNAQGSCYYSSALEAASAKGHEEVVKLLLEMEGDSNAQGRGYCSTALQVASAGGHEEIVRLLIEEGADVNAQGSGYYSNALQAASAKGHEEVVKLLLGLGADVNAQGGRFLNALEAASSRGHNVIVKLLLDCGAEVSPREIKYSHTALHAASDGDRVGNAKLLLDKGEDVHT